MLAGKINLNVCQYWVERGQLENRLIYGHKATSKRHVILVIMGEADKRFNQLCDLLHLSLICRYKQTLHAKSTFAELIFHWQISFGSFNKIQLLHTLTG